MTRGGLLPPSATLCYPKPCGVAEGVAESKRGLLPLAPFNINDLSGGGSRVADYLRNSGESTSVKRVFSIFRRSE